MATQAISIERRQRPREGILGRLENITYGVLRKYGITGEAIRESVISGRPQEGRATGRRVDRAAHGCRSGLLPAVPPLVQENQGRRPGKEDTTMAGNLVIVVSNPQPNRERFYPGTWLLYSRGHDPLEVHVARDSFNRPHVLDKSVA